MGLPVILVLIMVQNLWLASIIRGSAITHVMEYSDPSP